MKKIAIRGALCGAVLALTAAAAQAGTLEDVKANNILKCGVTTGNAGFSAPDEKGDWKGFDVDLCRAVAAAVLEDPFKVQFSPLSAKDRFPALQSGEIDILSRQTTWVLSREASLGLLFGSVTYYDGQGFLINAKKLPDVKSALDLSGATICLLAGTTTELNLADYLKANKIEYSPLVFEKIEEAKSAYDGGRCDVYSDDQSNLYSARLSLAQPTDHIVLPEIISKEPLGPVVRQGDDRWLNIVKWTHFAMVQAEEYGITQANVEEMENSANPDIRRLLGMEEGSKLGTDLGLSEDWVVRIVKAVGNYGEVFERNIGAGSPLKIARGLNALWTDQGLQYAMPVR